MLTSQDIVDKFYHAVDTTHRLDVQMVRQWLGVLRRRPAEEVFQALFGVFTNVSRPRTRFLDQEYAGAFLFTLQPPCPSDLTKTIRSILGTWDLSVEQPPLYFVSAAGDAEVRQALAKIELESLSDTERKGLETFRWWLAQPALIAPADFTIEPSARQVPIPFDRRGRDLEEFCRVFNGLSRLSPRAPLSQSASIRLRPLFLIGALSHALRFLSVNLR